MTSVLKASEEGDMDTLRARWRSSYAGRFLAVPPTVDAHPLLIAVHFLQPAAVEVRESYILTGTCVVRALVCVVPASIASD